MVTSSQPGTLDRMMLPVALIAILHVTCVFIAPLNIKFITAFTYDYLNRPRSVRSNRVSISEYLDA